MAAGVEHYGGPIANWREGLADVEVVLEVDGRQRRHGKGADVMGNPLTPLLWLVEKLRRWGLGLSAGEMISTGSTTGMLPVRAGQHVRAQFDSGACVEILLIA